MVGGDENVYVVNSDDDIKDLEDFVLDFEECEGDDDDDGNGLKVDELGR